MRRQVQLGALRPVPENHNENVLAHRRDQIQILEPDPADPQTQTLGRTMGKLSWPLTSFWRCNNLDKVINTGNNRHLSNVYKSLLTCGGLKKLVLCNSSSVIFPSTDLSPKTCVSFRRWSNNHQIVTERLGSKLKNDIYTSLNCIDQPGWDTYINRLKCTLPFGQNDAKVRTFCYVSYFGKVGKY